MALAPAFSDRVPPMSDISPTTLIAAATLGGLVVHQSLSLVKGKKLPPGPRRLPVIGNAHQLPTETPWIVFAEWGKIYGELLRSSPLAWNFHKMLWRFRGDNAR